MKGCLEDNRFKELKEKGTVFEDSKCGRICCRGIVTIHFRFQNRADDDRSV